MKKGVKIFLGVGCGLLLIAGIAVVVGILALNYVEKRLGESTAAFETEGREFGRKTDKKGCIDEGVSRSAKFGLIDVTPAIQNSAFIDACLETSRETPNFCDGVPSFWSMQDSEWGAAQCRKAGVDPERTGCVHALKRKHEFCIKPL